MHGIHVWVIGDEQPKSYDAIVTDKPGYTIAAPGADCQTLLFCDPVKMVSRLFIAYNYNKDLARYAQDMLNQFH